MPATRVVERREDLLSRVMRGRQVYQRNKNAEKTEHMDDQYNDLDRRERSTDEDVDENT